MDQALATTEDVLRQRAPGTAPGVAPGIAQERDLRRVGAHPDHWYPVAWSRELKRGKSLAVRFAGDPIVLVRPQDGPVFALADRCAHRQVPLSQGLVQGCAIRCGYHGWSYDQAGKCTDVPYLGRDKLPNGVRAYPCREVEGLILVFPGDPALADHRAVARFQFAVADPPLQDAPLRPRSRLPLLASCMKT